MSIQVKKLIYVPAPDIPAEFTAEFNRLVPINPQSGQRLLRYVWGCDRLEIRKYQEGKTPRRRYIDYDGKYLGNPRWVLEGWQTPEVYEEQDWKRWEHLLGTFPRNGVWDFIEFHQTTDEKFLPLDQTALERVRSWAFWRGQGVKKSVEKLLEDLALRDQMEIEARRQAAEKSSAIYADHYIKEVEKITRGGVSSSSPNPKPEKQTPGGIILLN